MKNDIFISSLGHPLKFSKDFSRISGSVLAIPQQDGPPIMCAFDFWLNNNTLKITGYQINCNSGL